jgi:hypothetical protein
MAEISVYWPLTGAAVDLTGSKCYIFVRLPNGQPGPVLADYNGVSVATPTFTTQLEQGNVWNGVFTKQDGASETIIYTGDASLVGGALVTEAPEDGKQYARKNGLWSEVESGGGGTVTDVKNSSGESLVTDGVATLKKFVAPYTYTIQAGSDQDVGPVSTVQIAAAAIAPSVIVTLKLKSELEPTRGYYEIDISKTNITQKLVNFAPTGYNFVYRNSDGTLNPSRQIEVFPVTRDTEAPGYTITWNADTRSISYTDAFGKTLETYVSYASGTDAQLAAYYTVNSYPQEGNFTLALYDELKEGGGSGGGITEAPDDGKLYGRQSKEWHEVPAPGISDAPNDGNPYIRQSQSWQQLEIPEPTGIDDVRNSTGETLVQGGIATLKSFAPSVEGQGGVAGNMTPSTWAELMLRLSGMDTLIQQALDQSSLTAWYNYGKEVLSAGEGLAVNFDDELKRIQHVNIGGVAAAPKLTIPIAGVAGFSGIFSFVLTRVADQVPSYREIDTANLPESVEFTLQENVSYDLSFVAPGCSTVTTPIHFNINTDTTANPVTPTFLINAAISLRVNAASNVTVSIYSATGRTVGVFLNDQKVATIPADGTSTPAFNIPSNGMTLRIDDDTGLYNYNWNNGLGFSADLKAAITDVLNLPIKGFAENATTLGNYAVQNLFQDCVNLVSAVDIVIPDGITSVGSWTFSSFFRSCTKLTTAPSFILPASLTTLGSETFQYAFAGCTALTQASNVTIPSTVTTIGDRDFRFMYQGCTSLRVPPLIMIYDGTTVGVGLFTSMFSGCTQMPSSFTRNFMPTRAKNMTEETFGTSVWASTLYRNEAGYRPRVMDGTELTLGFTTT